MNTSKTLIFEMPSAFNKELIVTRNMWAVSLVRTTTIARFDDPSAKLCSSQHANIFVQSSQDGEIIMTRLHAKPYRRENETERDPRYNNNYLDIEIKNNKDKEVNIIDVNTLHIAIKSLLWRQKAFEYFKDLDLLQHTANKTWLVSAQSASDLIENIKKQAHEFETISRPSFWRFGNQSVTIKAVNCVKHLLNHRVISAAYLYTSISALAAAGKAGLIAAALPYLSTGIASTVIINGATVAVYTMSPLAIMASFGISCATAFVLHWDATKPKLLIVCEAHSCFTWAREKLSLLKHDEINKFLEPKEFDKFIAMTSQYL